MFYIFAKDQTQSTLSRLTHPAESKSTAADVEGRALLRTLQRTFANPPICSTTSNAVLARRFDCRYTIRQPLSYKRPRLIAYCRELLLSWVKSDHLWVAAIIFCAAPCSVFLGFHLVHFFHNKILFTTVARQRRVPPNGGSCVNCCRRFEHYWDLRVSCLSSLIYIVLTSWLDRNGRHRYDHQILCYKIAFVCTSPTIRTHCGNSASLPPLPRSIASFRPCPPKSIP